MAAYLGDFAEDATLHFLWSTTGADGASITRATDGEVRVYKDNGVDQSTAGVTDTEDFDSLTGIHACTIDLSADAFYATGANYTVVLQGAVIDGQTVNAVLAHFSIENRYTGVADGLATYDPPTKTEMDTAHALLATPAQVASELATYDGPTKAEMDTALAALNDISPAEVNAEVDTALADYDAPTDAEMLAAFAALNNLSAAQANAACDTALSDYGGPTKTELDTAESNIRGADSDDLKALSDQIDALDTSAALTLNEFLALK